VLFTPSHNRTRQGISGTGQLEAGARNTHMAGNDALRREVSRLRSLVTKKVYRVKKNSGAHVSGTKYDPRPAVNVKQMTDTQLTSYASKFKDFLKRDAAHQFVPAYSRSVMPRSVFLEYKAAEKLANTKKESILSRYDTILMPGVMSETTVAEHRAKTRTEGLRRMMDDATYRPSEAHRQSTQIDGEAAARRLTERQIQQSDQAWFDKKIQDGRESYAKMMEMSGRPDLAHDVDILTDDQMGLLLFSTNFMETTSLKYKQIKDFMETNSRRKGVDDAIDEAFSEHDMWIEWAAAQRF